MKVRKSLKVIFWKFMSVRCFADGVDGNSTVVETPADTISDSGSQTSQSQGVEPKKEQAPAAPVNELETYIGSKLVNPEQRPLKNFNRKSFSSKEEMDKFIREAGSELIMSDEDIAAMNEQKKKTEKQEGDPEKKEKKTERGEDGKFKKKEEPGTEELTDEETAKAFYEKIGVDEKTFETLPETIQEKLAETFSKDQEVSEATSQIQQQYDQLIQATQKLEKDPVIAARLQELSTGKKYVATDLPAPNKQELSALMDAATDEESFKAALLEFMAEKAESVISVERSVIERKAAREKLEADVNNVVKEMIKAEKRIGITETDLTKIDENHKDYQAWKGDKGLFKFFEKHRLTLAQIRDLGSEKLLTLLAKDRGWDKERDTKIYQQGAKSFLQKLREAKEKARTVDMSGKSSVQDTKNSGNGYDRESLVTEIASGSFTRWEKLIEQASMSGNKRMVNELAAIRSEAVKSARNRHTPSDV